MQVILDQLDKLLEEKKYYLAVLRLWAHVDEQLGKKVREQVKAFTFRPEYLTNAERRRNTRPPGCNFYSSKTHHNAVRLHNGDLIQIPIIARPVIPDHMKVTVR